MTYYITNKATGVGVGDGAVLPTRATLLLDGVATAYGDCLIGLLDCSAGPSACKCTTMVDERTVNHFAAAEVIASQGSMSGTYTPFWVFGKDPATGLTTYEHLLDSRDTTTSTGSGSAYLLEPGSYTFVYTNFINPTTCNILPRTVTTTVTTYAIDPVNDDCNATVGKGIGLTTRTASVAEPDWSIAGAAPVDFVRYYNSYTASSARDFGTWSHSFDPRLISFGNMRKVIEPSGAMKMYRDANGSGTFTPVAPRGEQSYLTSLANGATARFLPDGTREEFTASGLLASRTDRNGNATVLTRDASNRLTQLSTAFGKVVLFETDASNRITAITLPDGQRIAYTYAGYTLQGVTYPGGAKRTYEHLGPGYQYLTGIKNENGQYAQKFLYDSYGRATQSSADGVNEKTSLSFSDNAHASATDSLGRVTTYVLSNDGGRGRATAISASCSQCAPGVVANVYDADLNLTSQTDAMGTTTRFEHDARGNVVVQADGFGTLDERTTRYSYDQWGNVESVLNGEGGLSSYAYDGRGNLIAWADAQGYGGTLTYDARGLLASATDPAGYTTTFGWDTSGNLAWRTNPLGQTESFTYDAMGRMLTSTFAGRAAIYTYDARGRLTAAVYPDGRSTSFEYDLTGRLKATTDALNNRTSRAYDSLGRLTSMTDPSGSTQTFSYDSESNLLSAVTRTSSGVVVRSVGYAYNEQNRASRITNADGTFIEFGYDAGGALTSQRNTGGSRTTYAYDALRRLAGSIDPAGGTTSLRYDRRSAILSATDPLGQVRSFLSDANGDLTWTSSQEGGIRTYVLGPGRRLFRETDARGIATVYSYDGLGRITNARYPDPSEDEEYIYDACPNGQGKLCWANSAATRIAYEYDAKGRLARETRSVDGLSFSVGYDYDALGRATSVTYPSGRTISYTYSGERLTAVTSGGVPILGSLSYEPFGGMSSISFANGLTQSFARDQLGRIASATIPGMHQEDYLYDAAGNVTSISDRIVPADSRTYGYDSLSRLTAANGPWGSLAYTYDAAGNRTSEASAAGFSAYQYSGSRLESLSGARAETYTCDANGFTVGIGQRSLTYNQAKRLAAVHDGGQLTASYTYGTDGLRVKKATANGTTYFTYDAWGHLLSESSGTGSTTVEYIYANDAPVAQIRGSDVYYYHVDHLSTPRLMTDASKQVVWRAGTAPFGDAAPTGVVVNNLRFPGQYFDEETGLHQNYFRDYQPSLGRYAEVDPLLHPFVSVTNLRLQGQYEERLLGSAGLQRDPLGLEGQMNGGYASDWYNYAGGNPNSYIDPKGLYWAPPPPPLWPAIPAFGIGYGIGTGARYIFPSIDRGFQRGLDRLFGPPDRPRPPPSPCSKFLTCKFLSAGGKGPAPGETMRCTYTCDDGARQWQVERRYTECPAEITVRVP